MPTGIPRPQRSPHLSGLKESVRQLLDLDDEAIRTADRDGLIEAHRIPDRNKL